MRIFLLCVFLLALIVIAVMTRTTPTLTPAIDQLPQQTENVNSQTRDGIAVINHSYSDLRSIEADATILFGTHRLEAKIFGQKPRGFRLRIKSLAGDEVDVGSNDHHFWYWFNRDDPETVYYNVYEKAEVLNIPLNPVWLAECFRLLPVVTENKMVRDDKITALVKTKAGFLHATIFDRNVTTIRGYYVYDSKNRITAFCDIKEEVTVDNMVMPKVVNVGFPQDDIYMEWRISNYHTNVDIPKSEFVIPNRKMSLIK